MAREHSRNAKPMARPARTALVRGRLLQSAGSTVPQHSPKPTRAAPGFRTSRESPPASPSSRNTRCSPPGSWRVLAASGQLNQCPGLIERGPDKVPLPSKSPGCRLQPLTVWWASIWAIVSTRGGSWCGRWWHRPGPACAMRGVRKAHLQLNVECALRLVGG